MKLQQEYRETTIINKSRFIACVSRCDTEEEARFYIDGIRREFPDSSHVCTAYMLGDNGQIQRSSDNGEPAGTAGVPMLEAIRRSGLQNVCACVVRYFGGIKLGAGGLIRAYSGCVSEALAHAPKTRDIPVRRWQITCPYELAGTLEGWLRHNTMVIDILYDEQVTCIFEAEDEKIPDRIRDMTKGAVEPLFLAETVREVPAG